MCLGFVRFVACICRMFFFSSRRRHTRFDCDWSSDVCSSDLAFKHRPAHSAAMADAAMNRLDVLVVWSIDRWGRSLVELLSSVEKLTDRGVAFEIGRASCRERV